MRNIELKRYRIKPGFDERNWKTKLWRSRSGLARQLGTAVAFSPDLKPGQRCMKLKILVNKYDSEYRGYSKFLLNMAFISPSEVENMYIS